MRSSGLSNAEATAAKALADGILAKMDATTAAQNVLAAARQIEAQLEATNQTQVRAAIRNWKTLPGYATSGSEAVLQLKGAAVTFDPATYKPVITATTFAGQVQIGFNKLGVDGLNIYYRLRGTGAWRKLGYDTIPPYCDTMPLQAANVPEVREYMARGVVNDVEIGLESDIVTATFAG